MKITEETSWYEVQDYINRHLDRPPDFRERQVWWCAFGENIGVEMNGKKLKRARPVVILKKCNKDFFCGVPLTSVVKRKLAPYNCFLGDVGGRRAMAILNHVRALDAARLIDKIDTIEKEKFGELKQKFLEYFAAEAE